MKTNSIFCQIFFHLVAILSLCFSYFSNFGSILKTLEYCWENAVWRKYYHKWHYYTIFKTSSIFVVLCVLTNLWKPAHESKPIIERTHQKFKHRYYFLPYFESFNSRSDPNHLSCYISTYFTKAATKIVSI